MKILRYLGVLNTDMEILLFLFTFGCKVKEGEAGVLKTVPLLYL